MFCSYLSQFLTVLAKKLDRWKGHGYTDLDLYPYPPLPVPKTRRGCETPAVPYGPLFNPTKNDVKWKWDLDEWTTFKLLKGKIISAPSGQFQTFPHRGRQLGL